MSDIELIQGQLPQWIRWVIYLIGLKAVSGFWDDFKRIYHDLKGIKNKTNYRRQSDEHNERMLRTLDSVTETLTEISKSMRAQTRFMEKMADAYDVDHERNKNILQQVSALYHKWINHPDPIPTNPSEQPD